MSKVVKYALLGFGGIARSRIASEGFGLGAGYEKPVGAELVAAFDIDASGRALAESWGLKWGASAEEILRDPAIDAVFIASINSAHAPLARLALNAGKNCLVEKPMATTVPEAEELVALASEKGLSLAVDHMMVKNALNRKAKEIVSAGEIGAVQGICLHMEFLYGSTSDEAASWRCSKPEELGGPIGDVGSHCLYMAEFLLGDKVAALSAAYALKTYELNVENGAQIGFEMRSGLRGSARVSFAENRGGPAGTLLNLGFEIYGENGAIRSYGTMFQLSGHAGEPVVQRLEVDNGNTVRVIRGDGIPVENIYKAVVEDHARSILTNTPTSGEEGLWNLGLIMAAHESARKSRERIVFH
jgi:1,5-anhydro-D-fructose reductase (1,5-anhydro-D-mannitol-forming)